MCIVLSFVDQAYSGTWSVVEWLLIPSSYLLIYFLIHLKRKRFQIVILVYYFRIFICKACPKAWFTKPSGRKHIASCNHCFAQIVFCSELYRRVHWNNHGCKFIVWRCISRGNQSPTQVPGRETGIRELRDFIAKQKTDITEFDETLLNSSSRRSPSFGHFTVEFESASQSTSKRKTATEVISSEGSACSYSLCWMMPTPFFS